MTKGKVRSSRYKGFQCYWQFEDENKFKEGMEVVSRSEGWSLEEDSERQQGPRFYKDMSFANNLNDHRVNSTSSFSDANTAQSAF